MPKDLQSVLEQVTECSEKGYEEDLPEGTPDELDDAGSDAGMTEASGCLEEA